MLHEEFLAAQRRLARLWARRHDDVGVQPSLRFAARAARQLRDQERAEAEYAYEAAWWADTSYPL